MANVVRSLVVLMFTGGVNLLAGDFEIRAVDLENKGINRVLVEVISGGRTIVSQTFLDGGQAGQKVQFNDAVLQPNNSEVTLRFSAVGRETVNLKRILGTDPQTVAVVMPEAEYREAAENRSSCTLCAACSVPTSSRCAPRARCSCPNSRRCKYYRCR